MKYVKMNEGKTAAGHPKHGVMSVGQIYELEDLEADAFISGGFATQVLKNQDAPSASQVELAELEKAEQAENEAAAVHQADADKLEQQVAREGAAVTGTGDSEVSPEAEAEAEDATEREAQASDAGAEDTAVALSEDKPEDEDAAPQRRRRTTRS